MSPFQGVRSHCVPLRFRFREVDVRAGGSATELPLLSVSVRHGVVERNAEDNGQAPSEDLTNYKRCWAGDVVLNRMRAFQGGLGVAPRAGIVSPDYAVLRFGRGCHPRYIHYLMRSHWFVGQMTSRLRGVGSPDGHQVRTPRINVSDLGEIVAPLPPLGAQKRVGDYLDAETTRIDSVMERNHELSRLAREQHERSVVELVSRGTSAREAGEGLGWCGGVEAGFVVGPYAMYGRTGSGHTPSRSVAEYWVDCDIPWVTTGDVQQLRSGYVERLHDSVYKISRVGMRNSAARLHPAGTVFLSRTASVGFAGIMGQPMATSQDFFTWTPDGRLLSEYLLWALRAMRYGGLFDRLMYGSTHKTIYVPDLLGLRGPIPPVVEQRRIVDAIRENRDHTVALTDRIERANALLRERREALITAAVTGEPGL